MGGINMEEIKIGKKFQFGIIKLKCVETMDASCMCFARNSSL